MTDEKTMKNNMHTDYNDEKLNKSKELNKNMTISERASDELENKIYNLDGGRTNG